MVEAYVIVGRANTGKSTAVREITGVSRRGVKVITKRDGTKLKVWIEVRALQEADEKLKDRPILPDRLIEKVSSSGCEAVLVTLRIEEPHYNRDIQTGSGRHYIDAFIKAGWTIQPPVGLGAEDDFKETFPLAACRT